MLTILTGAAAGLFHVLSGPDHLAAVAPLAVDERRRGWIAGCTWGIGHASGVVVVAVIAVLLREMLPSVDVISAWGERIVGGALIGIGLWAFRRSARIRLSAHTHGHAVTRSPTRAIRTGVGSPSRTRTRVVLHGRPSWRGRQLALLRRPARARPAVTRAQRSSYIGAFGVGTVVAMTTFAAVVGLVGVRTGQQPTAPQGHDDRCRGTGDAGRRCVAYCAAGVIRLPALSAAS